MTPDLGTALIAIDAAIGDHQCQHCGQPVSGSPSADFCSEDCQQTWHEQHASTPPTVPATADKPIPETAPARLLGWLGQPPPEAIVRAGHEVLDNVAAFVARFSVFPSEHCAPTLALWYAHTHAIEQFYVTPRLVLDSAEPGSGKTRVLEVAQYFVRAPEMTISATPAALFRLVSRVRSQSFLMRSTPSSTRATAEATTTCAGCSTPDTNDQPPSRAVLETPRK